MALPLSGLSRLAWRNLWRNHRRTIIMLLAIAIGTWGMIFTTALLKGMMVGIVHGRHRVTAWPCTGPRSPLPR